MQYKIPVQIENEDPIILSLSLRQLSIIMTGGGIAYALFKNIEQNFGTEIALIPSVFILLIALVIALFKNNEMTFVPFILSFLTFNINAKDRVWSSGVDSFQPIDIGYLTSNMQKKDGDIDVKSKKEKINSIEEQLKKI